MTEQTAKPIWIVVWAESGVISEVEAYASEAAALQQSQTWQAEMDGNDDDVQVFEVVLKNA